jgi:hypothetical protein
MPKEIAQLEPRAHSLYPRARRHYRVSRSPPMLEVAPFIGAVMSFPQPWQVFGTHRWNLDVNGASHEGHLILPRAKAHDTRSQGIANTTSKTASAVQT